MPLTAGLLGREAELRLVCQRVADRRLVSIVGPGGIGKTALARSCLEAAAGRFGGVLRADLTLVDDAAGVYESIAGQFGYRSFGAMLDAPGDYPVLLLVDNCEHILEVAADAIAELLESCEMPTVLTTSRAALGIPGEVVVPLGPLQLPPPGGAEGPAVALFVERASEAGVTVAVEDTEVGDTVAELVRRLDGVPLAIELAAARTRAMTPAEVLARLGDGLTVLDRPRRRAAQRHRSLRSAIEWSLDLLDPPARDLFAGLSVFAGPFRLEAAHAVVGDPSDPPSVTQDLLDELAGWSMVVAETNQAEAGYRLLETMRAVGREMLEADGRLPLIEARFADHVVARALGIIEQGSSTWSAAALADLMAIYGHIGAALRWCLAHDDTPDRALVLTAVLWGLVHQAHTEEIGALAEQALIRWPSSEHPLWADAVATAATCRYMLGDHQGAVDLATSALDVAERSPFAPATLRRAIAQSLRATGDAEAALVWFGEAAQHARALGLVSMATEAESARAQVQADLGDQVGAVATIAAARREADAAGSEVGSTWARIIHGSILSRSDLDGAAAELAGGLDQARHIGYEAGISVALRSLALIELLRGDPLAAGDHVSALVEGLLARGSTHEMRLAFDVASLVLAGCGRRKPAADLAATALSLPAVSITASVGHELIPLDRSEGRVLSTRDAIVLVRSELAAIQNRQERRQQVRRQQDDRPAPGRSGVFRRVGDGWEVGLDGELVTVRASKGMVDLARLLGSPGREIHCLELMGGGVVASGTGDVVDAEARRAYESRVRELQAEIDEAQADNDWARAERAREELDMLVDHLTAALGLGRRVRDTGSTVKRARSAVTQRIRTTIRRLESVAPPLGRHLAVAIHTGTFCGYDPEAPMEWEL